MAQIPSNVYTKSASYDFNLDGGIPNAGLNMGIVLNPGEFVISAWYKVTRAFVAPVPLTDAFVWTFTNDFFTPNYDIVLGVVAALNATVGSWANGRQVTTVGTLTRQTNTPPGTPSNNYLQCYSSAGVNTDGAMLISCLIMSTDN